MKLNELFTAFFIYLFLFFKECVCEREWVWVCESDLRSPPFMMVMTRHSSVLVWKAYASDTMNLLWTRARIRFSTMAPWESRTTRPMIFSSEHHTVSQEWAGQTHSGRFRSNNHISVADHVTDTFSCSLDSSHLCRKLYIIIISLYNTFHRVPANIWTNQTTVTPLISCIIICFWFTTDDSDLTNMMKLERIFPNSRILIF